MKQIQLNENEKRFVEILEKARRYCAGELEVVFDFSNDAWWARDYKELWGGSYIIETDDFELRPLILASTAKTYHIDVEKCCNYVGAYIVDC